MPQTNALKIAIAGLGTVGGGTLKLLQSQAALYALRAQRPLEVIAVSARDKTKDRGVDCSAYQWEEDAMKLVDIPEVDVVVETIGGAEGIAKDLVEAALKAGKHVVTANKALMASHGADLAQLAESQGVTLAYEAAVAGGIPVIKIMREGLAANQFSKVMGVLNGTSNYILTKMTKEKCSFEEALKEAQDLGYAEADPTFDVDGFDTAQKLSLMATLAFGCVPSYEAVHVEGIRHITPDDIKYATHLGYVIKLLGVAELTEHGLQQHVHPCMVPVNSAVAADGAANAIVLTGDAVGTVMVEGPGAGEGPTASSIISDLLDVARGHNVATFSSHFGKLKEIPFADMAHLRTAYYLRMQVLDQPGVLAQITGDLSEAGISVETFLQPGTMRDGKAPLVITTHETTEAAMRRALEKINALEAVVAAPQLIRMEIPE